MGEKCGIGRCNHELQVGSLLRINCKEDKSFIRSGVASTRLLNRLDVGSFPRAFKRERDRGKTRGLILRHMTR